MEDEKAGSARASYFGGEVGPSMPPWPDLSEGPYSTAGKEEEKVTGTEEPTGSRK